MADNDVFVQALADAIGRPVQISRRFRRPPHWEPAFQLGLAVGAYSSTRKRRLHTPGEPSNPGVEEAQRTASPRDRWLAAA